MPSVSSTQPSFVATHHTTLDRVVAVIKEQLEPISDEAFRENIIQHYKTLRLMNAKGDWALPQLAAIEEQLLPTVINQALVFEFVDGVAALSRKNDYLMTFLNQAHQGHYPRLIDKFNTESAKVIPDVICYAMALDALTRACASSHKLFAVISKAMSHERKRSGAFSHLSLFSRIKLISIDLPLKKLAQALETRKISPTSGKVSVSINILEASWTDLIAGKLGNAKAGWQLAMNPCGRKKSDRITGAGPTVISADGEKIQRSYPLPERWAALYQAWNMAFVTRFPYFPYVLTKLAIPQVANFYDNPSQYIHNRVIALFIHLHHRAFTQYDLFQRGEQGLDWQDQALTLNWSEANTIAAQKYRQELVSAKLAAKGKTLTV